MTQRWLHLVNCPRRGNQQQILLNAHDPFDDSIRTAMTTRILVTFSSRLAGGGYDLQKHAWVCSGSPAGINSIVCHNKKVQNFYDVSGALAVCVRVVTCADIHHPVRVRLGRPLPPRAWSKAPMGTYTGQRMGTLAYRMG
jgi:hypothetical protein